MFRAPLPLLAGLLSLFVWASMAPAQTVVPVALTTGEANKISLGFFSGGQLLQISVTGTGDLVDSRLQVSPDGSLAAPAQAPYTAANNGAPYPAVAGFPSGDGVNRFVGGGLNYDHGGGSGFMFAGKQTTDTTDPLAMRGGAMVGTFSATPTRNDWFLIGYGGTFAVPTGGATLFVAVNESFSADNHGTYSLTFTPVPEPSVVVLLAVGAAGVALRNHRRQR